MPDSDFPVLSGPEPVSGSPSVLLEVVFLEAVVLLSSDGGHCGGFSPLPLVCLGVIPSCAVPILASVVFLELLWVT